ncbi:MAG TPA: lytic murein transglycosylase [Xanthobacteraceae bacterium]|nr:lytic murein transglycosylase [Xanthobacteraceae bacterium]
MTRRQIALGLGIFLASTFAHGESGASFAAFLAGLWPDADRSGITRATFDSAFAGVTPDPAVLAAMRREPEYGKAFADYLASLVSPSRIAMGLRKSARWTATLRAVEDKFGVDANIIVSIWGVESSFGEGEQHWDVFRSLATLAQAGFQHPLFRNELLSALQILQAGYIPRRDFLGSWAGAMGQTQFLPSSYLKYAVDFDGDGKADIWHNVPDVLASIANYLHRSGWQPNLPWGFEVVLPQNFDFHASRGTFAEWLRRGMRRADGAALPTDGTAILFFPSGATGPAFLVTDNFIVLKRFNNSDAYALAVAELADRLRGLPPSRSAWPLDDFQPSRGERIALQHRLAALGYKIADFDGHLDFDLRDAVRDLQQKYGMVPDGHPSRAFLDRAGVRVP